MKYMSYNHYVLFHFYLQQAALESDAKKNPATVVPHKNKCCWRGCKNVLRSSFMWVWLSRNVSKWERSTGINANSRRSQSQIISPRLCEFVSVLAVTAIYCFCVRVQVSDRASGILYVLHLWLRRRLKGRYLILLLWYCLALQCT